MGSPNHPEPSPPPRADEVAGLRRRLAQQDREIQALRGAIERLQVGIETAGVVLWDWNVQTGQVAYPYVPKARAEFTPVIRARNLEEFLQVIHPDDRAGVAESVRAALVGGTDLDIEFRAVAPDGAVVWRTGKAHVVRDAAGKPLQLLGIGMDITKRKQAEEAQRSSDDRFRQLTENIDAVFWMTDWSATASIYVSPAYERIWGRTVESLYQAPHSFLEAVHPDERERVREAIVGRKEASFSLEYRIVRPDGAIRWIHDRGFPIRDAAGRVYRVAGIATDITDRKATEEALQVARNQLEMEVVRRTSDLRRAEEKYRTIFENSTEGIYQTTPEGLYLNANPALAQIDGYASAAELMESVTDIGAHLYVDPARRTEFTHQLQTQGFVKDFESQIRRKDGRVIWVTENARAVRDAQGQILYFEGTVQDVTDRKHLEAQLRQAQKMEAIGRLAGGVAHDFNNLLTGIIGYADLLMTDRTADDPIYDHLDQIKKAGERAAALTSQLLAFSRRQILAPRVLDLNNVVRDMEKILRRLLGEDVELVTELEPALGRVSADPGQVEQVILNLAINARDAMPEGGELIVSTANVEVDDALARAHPPLRVGPHVRLTVRDNGCGMDEQTKAHLFEPFFTTKEVGKGTGLGLATIYGIVKQSEGHIAVASERGHGTTFQIYLPRLPEAPRQGRRTWPSFQLPTGTETILLVEDEELVRNLAHTVLAANGYTVLVASDGAEALRLSDQLHAPIHLLVADIVMPRMSGRQLAEVLLRRRPELRVLYLSGYTDDAVIRHGVREAQAAFLQKPFTPDVLAQKVRAVLDQRSTAMEPP
ncbi:MAG: PAS domain S-box protein [Gemmataceae bacterium]|nr:PAS domain S-box protein [Gemmataceae bacterium]